MISEWVLWLVGDYIRWGADLWGMGVWIAGWLSPLRKGNHEGCPYGWLVACSRFPVNSVNISCPYGWLSGEGVACGGLAGYLAED